MKKLITVSILLLCLCLISGCGAQAVLHDVAEQLHNANAAAETEGSAPVSPSDGEAPAVAEESPAFDGQTEVYAASAADAAGDIVTAPEMMTPEPDTPAESSQGELAGLSLSELVADADGASGQLPRILPDCSGAASINEDIEGTFRYLVDADYCTLYYDVSKNGTILSIVVAQLYDGDSSYFTPYLLDLSSGQRLSGLELLTRMGLGTADVTAEELRIMGSEFEYQYGGESRGENAALYQEQYDRTVSRDNAELNRVWLDDQGQLCFVAKIYSMAGAEFYEYPMGTGIYFS